MRIRGISAQASCNIREVSLVPINEHRTKWRRRVGHFVAGWSIAKQNWQNGTSSIGVIDNEQRWKRLPDILWLLSVNCYGGQQEGRSKG